MLIGALLGGVLGERWHSKADPAGGQRQVPSRPRRPGGRTRPGGPRPRPGRPAHARPQGGHRGNPPHQPRHPGGHSRASQPVTARPLADQTMGRLGRIWRPRRRGVPSSTPWSRAISGHPSVQQLRGLYGQLRPRSNPGRPQPAARPGQLVELIEQRSSGDASHADAGDHSRPGVQRRPGARTGDARYLPDQAPVIPTAPASAALVSRAGFGHRPTRSAAVPSGSWRAEGSSEGRR